MGPSAPESFPVPAAAGGRPLRWALIGVGTLAALAATVLLYWHRPQGQFFYPRCSFHSITGWLCPGCGGMRALHELLHLRFLEAARCNALLVIGTPWFAAAWLAARWRGRPFQVRARTVWLLFAVAVVFTVLRNLPGGGTGWLAPRP